MHRNKLGRSAQFPSKFGPDKGSCSRVLDSCQKVCRTELVVKGNKTRTLVLYPLYETSLTLMFTTRNFTNRKISTKIEINQPILWENTWEITLTCRQGDEAAAGEAKRQFFVWPFRKSDVFLAKCREELSYWSKLPH